MGCWGRGFGASPSLPPLRGLNFGDSNPRLAYSRRGLRFVAAPRLGIVALLQPEALAQRDAEVEDAGEGDGGGAEALGDDGDALAGAFVGAGAAGGLEAGEQGED